MEGGAGIIVTAEEQTQLASPERVLVRGSGACALVAGVRACAMGLSWKPGEDEVKASVGSDWGELQGHRLLNQGPSLQEAGKFSPQHPQQAGKAPLWPEQHVQGLALDTMHQARQRLWQ